MRSKRTKEEVQTKPRTATGTTPSNQTRRQAGDFFQQLPGVLVNTGFCLGRLTNIILEWFGGLTLEILLVKPKKKEKIGTSYPCRPRVETQGDTKQKK